MSFTPFFKLSFAGPGGRAASVFVVVVTLLFAIIPSTSVAASASPLTSTASVSPSQVSPSQAVHISALFTSSIRVNNVIVDIEVYDSAATKVSQTTFPGQSFGRGQTHSYTALWTVPNNQVPGVYTVRTGVFSANWSTAYGWNNQAATVTVATSTQTSDVTITVDRTVPAATSQTALGVTHVQYSLDTWGNGPAVTAGKQLLQASTVYQNQHIMGWGGTNPEPAPGVYDWSSLDARLTLMRQTGGTPVITLCCSPDWMWGGATGSTDWSMLGTAPTANHYSDFANLAARIASRYPDVKYFQVWNEMKGFYNGSLNRWDYEGYTALYNQVYDALKAVSPDIKVGGPYVVMDSWGNKAAMSNPSSVTGAYGTLDQRPLDVIAYWLANKRGADFITVDAWAGNWDKVQTTDEFTATQKFPAVVTWLRQRTSLPIWWAEWYTSDLLGPATNKWDANHQNAVMATALAHMVSSGVAVPLRWAPQGVAGQAYAGDQESLWSDTRQAGGGQAYPFYATAKVLHDFFGPGTPLYDAQSSSPDVEVLASATKTLLINTRATPLSVKLNGSVVQLAGYEVRLV